ncbi:unnamed protein product [Ilex paraguariensis]|uniref:DC1 domain-containing protein n=1 Tax=Ilex paraguariensis TaxID=185542 RepID=A0ABC8RMJ1_9AQUA
MEYKHFSHTHNLIHHQVPPGTQIHCSGCNLPGTGSGTVYACRQCSYFLHEQCFQANRSMKHQSHPLHPLTLVPYPTYPPLPFSAIPSTKLELAFPTLVLIVSASCIGIPSRSDSNEATPVSGIVESQEQRRGRKHFSHDHTLNLSKVEENGAKTCSGCEKNLSDFAYICTESQCTFSLHKSCFKLPIKIQHKSHLDHPLTLLSSPPYKADGEFTCNACLKNGGAFTYNCSICTFDLHVDCVSLPETVKREDHEHPLTLLYSSQHKNVAEEEEEDSLVLCDVCHQAIHEISWVYHSQV